MMQLKYFYSILLLIVVTLSSNVQADGIITTLAGNGAGGYSGDNNIATNAQLKEPHDIVMDHAGNEYIVDTLNSVIRKISSDQIITTIAGNGTKGYTGDGNLATNAQLDWPQGIAVDSNDNIYIADTLSSVIRKVNSTDGKISTFAGVDFAGYNNDNVLATLSALYEPIGLVFDSTNNLYIADSKNGRIRKIDPSQIITTVANGLTLPTGISVDSADNIYLADNGSNLIQRIDKATGTLSTVIEGTALGGTVYDVAVDKQHNIYVSLKNNHLLVKLDSEGHITPIAGTGTAGYNSDNILATTALLHSPRGIALDNQDNLYFTDSGNHRLRKIELNVTLTVKKTGTGEGTITAPAGVITAINCDNTCTEATEAYVRNTIVDPINAVASEGSQFIGWSEACSGHESSVTVTLDVAKTCTAQFEKLYTLQAKKAGNGTGIVSSHEDPPLIQCGQEVDCIAQYPSGSAVTLKATPDEFNYFDGWKDDCNSTEISADVLLDANKICTATFKAFPQLTVENQGHGTITSKDNNIDCGTTCNAQYAVATEVELTAVANNDSTFSKWSGDCSGNSATTTVTLDATDKKCVAIFQLLPSLTVKVVGSGSVVIDEKQSCSDECSEFYQSGTSVGLVAEAISGSIFKGWSGQCSGTIMTTSLVIDKDKTCTANFEVLPILSVKTTGKGSVLSNPSGIECGLDCSEPYRTGTSVQLTAQPDSDSFLLGWSGNCSGNNPAVTVAVNSNISCTAAFELLEPPVTINKTGNGTITSNPAGLNCGSDCTTQIAPFPYNTTVQLTATADADWKFLEWSGACSGKAISADILVETTKTCTAQFKLAIPSITVEITGGGVVTSDPVGINCRTGGTECFKRFAAGAQITLTALADDGLQLKTWGGDCVGTETLTKVIVGEEVKTCTAIFEPPPPLPPDSTSLQFSLANYVANETGGEVIVLVTRAANKQGQVSVDYQTVDGEAIAGSDYQTVSGTLTWADGDNQHKEIRIPILKDNVTETTETATIRLTNIKGIARLGDISEAILTIVDIPTGGGLQFSANSYTVKENEQEIAITVDRVGGNEGTVSIDYATSDDQAIAGSDYISTQGSLTWIDGDIQSKQFKVSILPDNMQENGETLVLALANPAGGANLGAISTATLKILDSFGNPTTDFSTVPGTLQFTASNYQMGENEGIITITVSRTQGSKGVVEVNYATADDTAKTGQDYIGTAGKFRWLADDNSDKVFSIGVLDDGLREETENIILKLSDPSGGAILGDTAQAVLNIIDDDAVTIQWSSTDYLVDETGKTVTVSATRLGSPIGRIAVSYETVGTTATVGQDYQTAKGMLIWNHGDIQPKALTIPIIDDREVEGNESFQVRLFDLSENATLGTPVEATVTIVENDSSDCKPKTDVIDCLFINNGTLENVKITEYGTVSGGQLGGTIESEGLVQNVIFLPKTQLIGGLARGELTSDPIHPATLTNTQIVAGSHLGNIIVGKGSTVDSEVTLGEGVCFEDNISIPSVADLANILGTLSTPELNLRAIQLHRDVLCYNAVGGIIGAINGLQDLIRQDWALVQNPQNGYLELNIADFHFAVLPCQVQQILRKQVDEYIHSGMTVFPDKQVIFITHTGREIRTYPVVQNPKALLEALQRLGLSEISQQGNGQLKVPFGDKKYYSAYPSIFSLPAIENSMIGFAEESLTDFKGINRVLLRFVDTASSRLYQQYFYPSAADKEAFQGLSPESESILSADGQAEIYVGIGTTKRVYRGLFGYEVTAGPRSGRQEVEILETGDFNGDGWGDYQIIYPNGDRQIMYRDVRS